MLKVKCEVYSRIVGYLRPIQNWNKGKKREWKDRRAYDVNTRGDLRVLEGERVAEHRF